MCYLYRTIIFVLLLTERIDATFNYTIFCEDLTTECLTNSLQLVIPYFVSGTSELGVDSLDPYKIDKKLEFLLPGDITVEFTEGIASGLKSCLVDFARLWENTLEAQFHCNLTVTGKYKTTGRLLMFPVDGNGDCTIKCDNVRIHSVLKLGYKVKEDGQRYLEIIEVKTDHSFDGRVSYILTNLVKEYPVISNMVLAFLNNNWQMIAENFGGPFIECGGLAVIKNIKKILEMVPLDQIAPASLNLM